MRSIKIAFTFALLFSALPAFAEHDGKGPCSTYQATCKSDPSVTGATNKKSKWKAMGACVTAAATADTANGQKCPTAKANHKKHDKDHD